MTRVISSVHQSNQSSDGNIVGSSSLTTSHSSDGDDDASHHVGSHTSHSSSTTTTTVDGLSQTFATSRTIAIDGDDSAAVTRAEGSVGDDQILVTSKDGTASLIEAGSGDDVVFAGDGDDIIDGGSGTDLLAGGDGTDTFRVRPGNNVDIVLDFEQGVDTIDISAFGLTSLSGLVIDGNTLDLGNGDKIIVLGIDALDVADVTL